jgi:hypothetical protein
MQAGAMAGAITQLASDGTWSWFSDPRALVDNGTLYTGWVTTKGDVRIGSYQLTTGAESDLALAPLFEPDDHDNPALLKTVDGRITAFYARHSVSGTYTQYRTTINPGDISTWSKQTSVGTNTGGGHGATYANPFLIPGQENKAYLFWRGGNFNPTYSTGTYNPSFGTWSWTKATTLIANSYQRPYVKYESNGVDRVGFVFTDGHPDKTKNNVYYASVGTDSAGQPAYFRADGTKIKNLSAGPLRPAEAQKVFNKLAGGGRADNAWVWDCAFDDDGRPVVAYSVFVDNNVKQHAYHWARWNGSTWEDHTLVANAGGSIAAPKANQPYYSGGIALDHENPGIAYLSRQIGSRWELEQWKSADDGATWSTLPITTASSANNIRPVVPRDRPDDTEMVLWLSGTYYDYANPKAKLYKRRTASALNYNTTVQLWVNPVSPPPVAALRADTPAAHAAAATPTPNPSWPALANMKVRFIGPALPDAARAGDMPLQPASGSIALSQPDIGHPLLVTEVLAGGSGTSNALIQPLSPNSAILASPSLSVQAVPEPGTLLLLCTAIVGLAVRGWRRAVRDSRATNRY